MLTVVETIPILARFWVGLSCCVDNPVQASQTSPGRPEVRRTVADIARAMATMDGVQALSRFDDGFTSTYFNKAEALLDLAIECALERRRGD